MQSPRLQTIGFFTLLAIGIILTIFLFWPFLQLIALAGILAVLFSPWHKRIITRIKFASWSALLTVLFVLLIVLVPLFLMSFVLYKEVGNLYASFANGTFNIDRATIVSHLPVQMQAVGSQFLADLGQRLSGIAGYTVQGVTGLLSNVFNFFFALFLVFFTLFYFLRDGGKLKEFFSGILPLSKAHESEIMTKLELAINGIVKGSFLVALAQGGVALVGFFIFGVPQPVIWAAFTVLAALVPNFGTSLALIPAVLYLFLTGHTGAGIGMTIWGAAAVGTIDNFISPRLIGSRTNVHPLLILFSVVGGIQLFGILGFLLGPLVMAIVVALFEIYKSEAY